MIDLSAIIKAVVALFAAVITTFLVPWLKSKLSESQWNIMTSVVQHGVKAAEQQFSAGQGQQKKQYVVDYLASKGYTADDAVIEATVNSCCGKSRAVSGEFSEVE